MNWLLLLICAGSLQAQIFTLSKEQMLRYTAKNPFERFEDARPKVPDALLEKVRGLSVEEIWGVLPATGFPNQYEGSWQIVHPGKKLVGRALTAQFMPIRADLAEVINADAKAKNYRGSPNQWVIDMLQPGDVLVIDLFGKQDGGTFVGDNLAAAVLSASKTGLVVDGAVRDLEGIFPLGMPVYTRGFHPSAIRDVVLTGVNIPIRIGNATVMPGDVVFGDRTGVYFIPPQHVEEIVKKADTTHIHDEWTKNKFLTGKFKSTDLYSTPRDPALLKEYEEYLKKRLAETK
jgi:regulator of RNase E activity RraA